MPFIRPTLTELIDRVSADIQSKVEAESSLLRRSVLKVLAKVFAGAIHLLYSYLGYQSEQLFASTADTENLEALASEYGINRKAATKATGSVIITGTDGTVIPADTELQSDDDVVYVVDSEGTISGGFLIADVTADVAGESGNEDAAVGLTYVSPIVGADTAAVYTDGIIGGADEETDTSLRNRLLLRKQFPPYGGSQYDYENWMLEYPGVTRSWCFPTYAGVGTVGCAFAMDDTTPVIPTPATNALVRAYIVEHEDPATGRTVGCPVTAEQGLTMIDLTGLAINFTISIYPNTTTVTNAIDAELADMIKRLGGPGETIYISDIQSSLSSVSGLEKFTIVAPATNQTALSTQIHTLGTTTYSDY